MTLFVYQVGTLSGDSSGELPIRLTADARDRLAAIIENTSEQFPALDRGIDSAALSVAGLPETKPTAFDELCPGDYVLYVEGRQIVSAQYIDFKLGDTVPDALRTEIVDAIRDDMDESRVWFSTTPVVDLDSSLDDLEDILADHGISVSIDDLFVENPFNSLPDISAAFDSEAAVIESLGGSTPRKRIPDVGSYFILRTGSDRYEDIPAEEYQFRAGIPGSKQLRQAANDGWFVYQEDDEFYGHGFIGEIHEEQRDGETHYTAQIERYEEFPPVALSDVREDLSVHYPVQFGIIKVDRDDIETVTAASYPPVRGPTYESIGNAYVDIKNRLSELDREGWLAEQPADVLIDGWTEALDEVDTDSTLSWEAAARVKQLIELYEEYQDRLGALAEELEAGHLEDLSGAETLFVVFVRDLQDRAGLRQNFTAEKFRVLKERTYSIRFPETGEQDPRSRPTPSYITPPPKPDRADEIAQQLTATKQVVFYGPPGTSKTYTAQQFARWWAGNQEAVHATTDQIRTVTLHPSLSYEDFIEGLTAKSSSGGTVEYTIEKGIFRQISEEAAKAYREADDAGAAPRYILIIDEINRGNISQIFGELITLLEADKRTDGENHTTVDLAHSGTPFDIPPNLYIIGTMNTADRSIALLDAAIRRRFRFLPFQPDYQLLLDEHGFGDVETAVDAISPDADVDRALRALSILALRHINNRLLESRDIDKGKQVGHTYLLNVDTAEELTAAWRYEILPLLEELFYGQFSRLREEVFAGGGDRLFDWDRQAIAAVTQDDLIYELIRLVDSDRPEPLLDQFTRADDGNE